MQDLYNSENHPKCIAIEAEEELYEDGNGHTVLKSEVVKPLKTCEERRPQYIPTYQSIYLRNWETVD